MGELVLKSCLRPDVLFLIWGQGIWQEWGGDATQGLGKLGKCFTAELRPISLSFKGTSEAVP